MQDPRGSAEISQRNPRVWLEGCQDFVSERCEIKTHCNCQCQSEVSPRNSGKSGKTAKTTTSSGGRPTCTTDYMERVSFPRRRTTLSVPVQSVPEFPRGRLFCSRGPCQAWGFPQQKWAAPGGKMGCASFRT